MMKVKVINNFYDKEANLVLRHEGDIIEMRKERADRLTKMRLVIPVEPKSKKEDA